MSFREKGWLKRPVLAACNLSDLKTINHAGLQKYLFDINGLRKVRNELGTSESIKNILLLYHIRLGIEDDSKLAE